MAHSTPRLRDEGDRPAGATRQGGSAWAAPALGAALAWFGWLAWSFRGYTPDDTYIYLRFAENVAEGHGLVFNAGERVYGNTSVLWTLTLALAHWAGWPVLAVAKCIGAALGALTVVITQRIARQMDPVASIAAPLIIVGFLDIAYWSVSGMDTALFTSAVALALLATLRAADGGSLAAAALAWGVAGAVRPEGAGLGIVALSWLWTARRPSARATLVSAAAFAVPAGGVLLFGWIYYGDPLPNPYWAKRFDRVESLHRGLVYLRAFTMANDGALMAGAVAAALLLARTAGVKLLSWFLAAYCAYLVWTGGDSWMAPQVFRFAVPALPALSVLIAIGVCGVWRLAGGETSRWRFVLPAAVLGMWLAFPSTAGMVVQRVGGDPGIVAHLRAHSAPGDSVAVTDIGWVGYETGLRVIDTFGLVDPWVARSLRKRNNSQYRPGEAERLVDYVLERSPRWIILKGTRRSDGTLDIHDETGAPIMYEDARFGDRYRFVLAGSPEPYLLFERGAP